MNSLPGLEYEVESVSMYVEKFPSIHLRFYPLGYIKQAREEFSFSFLQKAYVKIEDFQENQAILFLNENPPACTSK